MVHEPGKIFQEQIIIIIICILRSFYIYGT